jgi:Transposase
MRFYTKPHQFYCGIDRHARTMYLCILNQAGDILVHRNMPAAPEPLLKTIAPYREDVVVCVECIFTWYWLADLCAQEGIPFVLGHALYMKAIHGGKAKHDKIDSQKIAALLRGGMLPQAYVYPAAMRATRDLLRRRMHLARKRAELLAHIQQTNSQYHLPAIGKKIAYKANRDGVAERFADPAGHESIEVDLRSSAMTRSCCAMSHSPSATPPNTMTPTPCICCKPCPASARSSASCCAMKSMTSTVFPRYRMLSPTAVWSNVPRHPPGNAWALQAPRSAMPISNGPFLRPLSCSCATIR